MTMLEDFNKLKSEMIIPDPHLPGVKVWNMDHPKWREFCQMGVKLKRSGLI